MEANVTVVVSNIDPETSAGRNEKVNKPDMRLTSMSKVQIYLILYHIFRSRLIFVVDISITN